MIIIGYIAAGLIGISLGLIGGGGSILTVPVLVYLFGISPTVATSYSLFVVGITSLTGAYSSQKNSQVDTMTVMHFGIVSVVTVFLVRQFLLPILPENLFLVGAHVVTKSLLTMLLFAILMLLAALYMIRNHNDYPVSHKTTKTSKLLLYGLMIGLVTGILGAGGGFLLIPAMMMLVKLPMKRAIGTSLAIISVTSLFGFIIDLFQQKIEWSLLIPITAIALSGIIVGIKMSQNIEGAKLKKGFGWFVMAMGIFILATQIAAFFFK